MFISVPWKWCSGILNAGTMASIQNTHRAPVGTWHAKCHVVLQCFKAFICLLCNSLLLCVQSMVKNQVCDSAKTQTSRLVRVLKT